MAQDYDKILKENLTPMFSDLGKEYLKLAIAKSEPLKDKLQQTIEREADFLQKVTTTTGEEFIVHVELQSTDHPKMLERMQLYHALMSLRYDLPIVQYVIYFGDKPTKMQARLPPEKVFKGFNLISLKEVATLPFLEATSPEQVLWAVFSNFDKGDARHVLTKIIERLRELTDSSESLEKYIFQLITLSRLRGLTQLTQQILKDMPITFDIKKDAFYQEGVEKGIKKGIQKGREEGRQEGVLQTALNMKKAGVAIADIVKYTGLTKAQVEKL